MSMTERLTMRNSTTKEAFLIDIDDDDVKDAIRKLADYEDIGTVSEFRELKEKATAIKSDGFSDHLLNMGYTKGMKDGYSKAIEEFAEKMKELFKHIKVAESVIDMVVKEMKGEQP